MHFINFCTTIDVDQHLLVLPLHAETQFCCTTPDQTYINIWNVNKTMVTSNSSFPGVVGIASRTLSNGSTQGSLSFKAYAYANNTEIMCVFANGLVHLTKVKYKILIQGMLYAYEFSAYTIL